MIEGFGSLTDEDPWKCRAVEPFGTLILAA